MAKSGVRSSSEKTLYESKPAKRVLITWFFTKFMFFIALYGFMLTIVFGETQFFAMHIGQITVGFTILSLITFIYMIFLRMTYNYKITDKGIYFIGGIIVRRQKFVPFFKITNVETSQNIIEQIFGTSQIGFQTAGNGGQPKPEITFEGLIELDKPKKLVYTLMEKNKGRGD